MCSATLSVFPGQLTTPFSQMTDILSSTPLTPLGILVKSSLPRAFWHTEKVQLSVPVTVRSSLEGFHGEKQMSLTKQVLEITSEDAK